MEVITYFVMFLISAFILYIGYNKNSRTLCSFAAIMILLLHINIISLSASATGGLGFITGTNQTTINNVTITENIYGNVFFGGTLGVQSYALLMVCLAMYILFVMYMPEKRL